MCWSGVTRSFVTSSGLACAECGLHGAVLCKSREEPLKRPLPNLVVDFSGSLLLQDRVAMHPRDVVDTTDAKALAEESKFCLWVLTQLTRSCIARTTSALAKSWSAMNCRGPAATPSVVLPTGHVMHVTKSPLRRCCTRVVHVVDDFRFLWVSFCSNFGVGVVEFLGTKIG